MLPLTVRILVFCALTLAVSGGAHAASAAREKASGASHMVVTPDKRATNAAAAVLEAGGSAADAAIAAQLVLGLVRPDLTGLGGGGFALAFDAETGALSAFDAREAAPAQAGKYLFTDEAGQPLEPPRAAVGGRAVGVPGVPALIGKLHEADGRLPWEEILGPALWLAENGFEVSPGLARAIDAHKAALGAYPGGREYFLTAFGEPRAEGEMLRNPDYGKTLKRLGGGGIDAFYQNELAAGIAQAVQERAFDNRGMLSIEDLQQYEVRSPEPACVPYGGFSICAVTAPSSGSTVLEALSILSKLDLSAGPENSRSWHAIAEASRIAFADRAAYLTDSLYMPLPETHFLSESYAVKRAGAFEPGAVLAGPSPAGVDGVPVPPRHENEAGEEGAYIAVVDSKGNAVSMATGLGERFGAHLMTDGFLLNAALTDFSFVPEKDGGVLANRVGPMKRPRSMLTPLVVLDKASGKPVLVIGSVQGAQGVAILISRLVSILEWGMSLEQALARPEFAALGEVMVEEGMGGIPRLLEKRGHTVRAQDIGSSIAGIHITGSKITGVAASRDTGQVRGK